jgi:tetratricopeptide (TPR) repeat protein
MAWCLGKLKRFKEEEMHLRRCLEIDPKFPCALNNFGWSLYKQRDFEAALTIFEDAIKRGNDGKYPLRNRAQTLEKLGRFEEAIQAWRLVQGERKPIAYIERRLADLTDRIGKPMTTEVVGEEDLGDNIEESLVGEASPKEAQKESPTISTISRIPIHTEQLLESMVEKLIDNGAEVFGRTLRMYQSSLGVRGRQFIIPGHGRIDLLAEDVGNNELVVIELKKDESHDIVVGQIAMYMAWVRENLAQENQKVVGVICVFSASPKLSLAARSVSGLEVFEYDLGFRAI